MFKAIRLIAVAAMAGALVTAVAAAPASAAPVSKGETTLRSPLVESASLLGIDVRPTGPAHKGVGNAYVFPVVGNPENGKLMQVGGILLTKRSNGQTLSFENTHVNLETLVVTAVVNGGDRVAICQAQKWGSQGVYMTFTPEGAAIVRDYINFFGIPRPGDPFGWASTTATLPEF